MNESTIKLNRLRQLAETRNLDAILLQRVSSVAWATCGAAPYVNLARSEAEVSLLVTREAQHLFTNNIEAVRLQQEEQLASQGWEFHVSPWFEGNTLLTQAMRGLKVGADGFFPGAVDLSHEIARLRAALTPAEGDRLRALARLCAQAMEATAWSLWPGQTEQEIAALLTCEAERRGVQVIVNLIATDERIFRYRHPLPTARKLERYAMLVLCGRRQGLVCSLTRLVHFGPLSDEIRRKSEAVARVDAALIAATRPGRTLRDLFALAQEEYARAGYAEEWTLHHQGGAAGYEPREYVATPDSQDTVSVGQAFAWNPSITGTKSEDTILVGTESNEVLTAIAGWPVRTMEVDGLTLERPEILIVD